MFLPCHAQSHLTLCDPVDYSLPGSSVQGDSPGKNTGVGCHFLLQGAFLTQGSNLQLLSLLYCRWITCWAITIVLICIFLLNNGFSSSHVWMWELDDKESWVPKEWCFWNVVLEKTLESPLDCKEIQPAHPKGNQSWIFIRRTDAEAETVIFWPPDAKNWLTGNDPDAGRDWRQEEEIAEDEMVGWHQRLNGHPFE